MWYNICPSRLRPRFRKWEDVQIVMKKTLLFDIVSGSVDETESAGERLAYLVSELKCPKFVAMYGDLGVGKTAFSRGFVRVFIPDAPVCSPTYSIINEYSEGDHVICHIDAYRIDSDDDLYSCGFYDYDDATIVLLEWSENVPYAHPNAFTKLTISRVDEHSRRIVAQIIEKEDGDFPC